MEMWKEKKKRQTRSVRIDRNEGETESTIHMKQMRHVCSDANRNRVVTSDSTAPK